MSALRFTDGVTIETEGKPRALRLHDGWYVVGYGQLIPCEQNEVDKLIREMEVAHND